MKITDIKEEDKKMTFTLKDADPATANAIRRTSLRELSTMAVTEIDFFKNTGVMTDEFIAHRIGMIPITTPEKYKPPEECEDENDPECSTTLTLSAKGPKTVHASEINPEDSKIKILYPKTQITKLGEDQEIDLEAIAHIGKGKDHARHKSCFTIYKTDSDKEYSKDKQKEFKFTIESYTEKSPKEILKETLKTIQDKTDELKGDI